MGKSNKETKESFEFLGTDFQAKLIAQLLTDKIFHGKMIDLLEVNFFEDTWRKTIIKYLIDAYDNDQGFLDIPMMKLRVNASSLDKVMTKHINQFLIEDVPKLCGEGDATYIQKLGINFCKQQKLKRTIQKIDDIINTGDVERYHECEDLLKKALELGQGSDETIDVCSNVDDVLSDDFRIPIPTGIVGLDEYMDGGLAKGELGVILAPFGVGKSLPNSNKIYTPDGYKLMGDISVGDLVISRRGRPTEVLGVYPQGVRPIYKISFNDGTFTFCDEEHLWAVNGINQRNRSSWKNRKRIKLPPDNSFKVLKTSEIIGKLTFGTKKSLNYKIPLVKPVEFIERPLPMHPYALGLYLGDGYMRTSRLTTKDDEVINELKHIFGDDLVSVTERCRDIDKGDFLIQQCLFSVIVYGITDIIRSLNLFDKKSDTKFVPKDYLYNSIDNRINLLQGLLDTDGTVNAHGGIEYTTVSHQLASDVRELVLSLGGFCKLKTKQPKYTYKGVKKLGKLAYTLNISFPNTNGLAPFKLTRKLEKIRNRVKYSENKFIKSIEYSHDEEAACIMVDDIEHLFVTDDFIVTHNTTMMTKLANHAKNCGFNVLQIFFEDIPKVIQRKHYTCWYNLEKNPQITLNEVKDNKDAIAEVVRRREKEKGAIKLIRFPSDGTTIPKIRQYIKKITAQGFKPDIVLLDYIDCLQPSTRFDDQYAGEGNIMRAFETILAELDIVGWTAVQGNRSSIGAQLVEAQQMGGSIKRGQIGHFIVSIAKTLEQKDDGIATMAILKSRFGKDGIIFNNIIFDNGRIVIDVSKETGQTFLQAKETKEVNQSAHVKSLLETRQAKLAMKRPSENELQIGEAPLQG